MAASACAYQQPHIQYQRRLDRRRDDCVISNLCDFCISNVSASVTSATATSAFLYRRRFIDIQLQRRRCAATAAGHSAQRILSDFIFICNGNSDSFGCSVSEQQFSDSGHCASASVSVFGVGDSSAALAFGSNNIFGFSVQLRLAAASSHVRPRC